MMIIKVNGQNTLVNGSSEPFFAAILEQYDLLQRRLAILEEGLKEIAKKASIQSSGFAKEVDEIASKALQEIDEAK